MKDLNVNDSFMLQGGTDVACMSTSSNLKVIANYAKSRSPLLFRIKVTSPMDLGADIQWLSLYPGEEEGKCEAWETAYAHKLTASRVRPQFFTHH